MLDNTQQAEW